MHWGKTAAIRATLSSCPGGILGAWRSVMRSIDEFFEAYERRIHRDLIDIGSAAGVVLVVVMLLI